MIMVNDDYVLGCLMLLIGCLLLCVVLFVVLTVVVFMRFVLSVVSVVCCLNGCVLKSPQPYLQAYIRVCTYIYIYVHTCVYIYIYI